MTVVLQNGNSLFTGAESRVTQFLNDVADQTGTVRGRIERVEMSLKTGFHMIVTVIVSICRRLIGDTSLMCQSR